MCGMSGLLRVRFVLVQIYCNWRWPTPIVLQQIDHQNPMGMKQWDPRLDYRDQSHLMPIITPAYPCMNSSYNVSDSTLKIMMVSFMLGAQRGTCASKLCMKSGTSIMGIAGSEQPLPCWVRKQKHVHVLLSTFQLALLGFFQQCFLQHQNMSVQEQRCFSYWHSMGTLPDKSCIVHFYSHILT